MIAKWLAFLIWIGLLHKFQVFQPIFVWWCSLSSYLSILFNSACFLPFVLYIQWVAFVILANTEKGKICPFNCVHFVLLRYYSSLEVASEYFRSGADKISIGSDAVYAAEAFLQTGVCILFFSLNVQLFPHYIVISVYQVKTGKSSLEQISRVYGNQVFFIFITLFCFIAQLQNIN